MAYADQQGLTGNRLIAVIIVIALHVGFFAFLVGGLAYQAYQKKKERMAAIEVTKEEEKKEEPPPPDEKPIEPPPVTAPPPPFTPPSNTPLKPPPSPKDPPPLSPKVGEKSEPSGSGVTCWNGSTAPSLAQCPPKPPETKTCPNGQSIPASQDCPKPAPKRPKPVPKGNPGNWANANDYPSSDLNKENEGTTGFSVTVGPDGRVTSCSVTRSSGHPGLDSATCKNIQRRARFDPALDGDGNPTSGTWGSSVRWVIPK